MWGIKYYNQTGTANATMSGPNWSGNLAYTTNPAGVNGMYLRYLAGNNFQFMHNSAGDGKMGDPLNTDDVKNYAGGDFGKFWKTVFPMGQNDCDLQAAINNITDKINQFRQHINMPPGGLKGWVQQPGLFAAGNQSGQQGDVYAYVSNSFNALQNILNQYQAKYNSNVGNGGGCAYGLLQADYNAYMTNKRQQQQQLETEKLSEEQQIQMTTEKAQAAANAAKILAQTQAGVAGMQGSAAGSAASGATSGLRTFLMIGAGIAVVGGIVYFATKKKK